MLKFTSERAATEFDPVTAKAEWAVDEECSIIDLVNTFVKACHFETWLDSTIERGFAEYLGIDPNALEEIRVAHPFVDDEAVYETDESEVAIEKAATEG